MRWREIIEEKSLVFRHQSPKWLKELRPLTYDELADSRTTEGMEYIRDRKRYEDVYRELTGRGNDLSFLYATVVGFHEMESPTSYPGFTYYFHLTDEQISQCVFDIVDEHPLMRPELGLPGITRAMKLWTDNDHHTTHDDILGTIDPRIEVIIPFTIQWESFVPQIEDRTKGEHYGKYED